MKRKISRARRSLPYVAFQVNGAILAVGIVEALTAATRPEDLAEALAWFNIALPAQQAQELLQMIRNRAITVHGCTALQSSVPFPTRALNNEVACTMMIKVLGLAFDIYLTGLRSAAHLNGREGVISGPDSVNAERWTAHLDDGTCVSVRFQVNGAVLAVGIVEALTAATRPVDLAEALAWFNIALPAQQAQELLQMIRNRANTVHGCACEDRRASWGEDGQLPHPRGSHSTCCGICHHTAEQE